MMPPVNSEEHDSRRGPRGVGCLPGVDSAHRAPPRQPTEQHPTCCTVSATQAIRSYWYTQKNMIWVMGQAGSGACLTSIVLTELQSPVHELGSSAVMAAKALMAVVGLGKR